MGRLSIDEKWGRFGPDRCPTLEALRARRQVQLWTLRLPVADFDQQGYRRCLSTAEHERAQRFRFVRNAQRFVSVRGWLRHRIAGYLAMAPGEVKFEYGQYHKPAVAGNSGLQFNLAHSGDYAVCALAADARVGIDIERMRAMSDQEALARRFFSPAEYHDLMAVPKAERESVFFACWTRKEAYVKAVGRGLSLDLASFRVSVLPQAAPELLAGAEGESWTLLDFEPAPGYRGALALEGRSWTLLRMDEVLAGWTPQDAGQREILAGWVGH